MGGSGGGLKRVKTTCKLHVRTQPRIKLARESDQERRRACGLHGEGRSHGLRAGPYRATR